MTRRTCALSILAASLLVGQVHKSPMPGKWYPADPPALNKLLDQSFSIAGKRTGSAPPRKKLRALVAPHAALPYSGVIAASAYRLLDGPKNVIVLGFSHTRPLRGVIAPDLDAYLTPLGEIKVNREAAKQLQFRQMSEDQLCDHSLENQLPFVQRAAPTAGLIPLYVGDLTSEELQLAARKLARRMERGDVVIASSDFTHYGKAYRYTPFPNDKELPRKLFQRAMVTFELIGSVDVAEFDRFVVATRDNLCGLRPVRLLMAALAQLKEDTYLSALDYMASGELTRDYSLSVGYGALAFYPSSAFAVGEQDQKRLLASARQTLDKYLASGKKERVPLPVAERGTDLKQHAGVFVTIKKSGKLRGCVGSVFARKPLYEAVVDSTLAAASADPRFPPVTAKDGPVSIEISLLTPLKRLMDWREFQLGQGAFLVLKGKSGLILPQVAADKGWNREQFLENLSRKAGLNPNAYRDPQVSIYVYSADVFQEAAPQPRAADGTR